MTKHCRLTTLLMADRELEFKRSDPDILSVEPDKKTFNERVTLVDGTRFFATPVDNATLRCNGLLCIVDDSKPREIPPPDAHVPLLLHADGLIHGDRAKAYGNVHDNFGRWAKLCDAVGIDVTADELAMIMVLGKLARQANKKNRDNVVDAAGYLGLYDELLGEK